MKDDKPLVSIVLAVKNGEDTLGEFFESVKKQTYSNIELIVVDNFSSDNTREISQKLTNLFFQRGPERSAQRNFGIQQASGEIVLIADADLYLKPGLVEEIVSIFEEKSEIQFLFIPEDTLVDNFWGKCHRFERDFHKNGDISVEAGRAFRRKVLLDSGGYNEKLSGGEDWELTDRLIIKYDFGRTQTSWNHDERGFNLNKFLAKKKYYQNTGLIDYLSIAPKYRLSSYPFRPGNKSRWYLFLLHPILTVGTFYMKLKPKFSKTKSSS